MRRLCLISGVVVLLALVAGQALAQAPPDWVPQAAIPVALTVDGYGKITVVNSSLDLEICMEGPPPEPWWPQDFVHLDIEANMDVILDVHATNNGRLRSDQGVWFKNDQEHGTRLYYSVCGGWTNTPEEFQEYYYAPPIPELGRGSNWVPPESGWGPPEAGNHLWNSWTNEIGYPIPWGPDSRPVTLGGSAFFSDGAPDPIPPPMGVYRGELIVTIAPAPALP